jgi:hypothetical protein
MIDAFDIIAFVVFCVLLTIPMPLALHGALWLQP